MPTCNLTTNDDVHVDEDDDEGVVSKKDCEANDSCWMTVAQDAETWKALEESFVKRGLS